LLVRAIIRGESRGESRVVRHPDIWHPKVKKIVAFFVKRDLNFRFQSKFFKLVVVYIPRRTLIQLNFSSHLVAENLVANIVQKNYKKNLFTYLLQKDTLDCRSRNK